jgi:RNA-binding protein
MLGIDGLTPAVVAEIERALKSHELIKIRIAGAERDEREQILSEVCAQTGAEAVQHIGKILVVYRENKDNKEKEQARKAKARPARRSAPRTSASPGKAKRPSRALPAPTSRRTSSRVSTPAREPVQAAARRRPRSPR